MRVLFLYQRWYFNDFNSGSTYLQFLLVSSKILRYLLAKTEYTEQLETYSQIA